MSKQRITNNGPTIRNGSMVGNGTPGIKPVNGSWTQGVEAARTQDVRARMAAAQQQQPTPSVKQTAPTQQTTMKGPKP